LLSKESLRSEFALKLLPVFAALVFSFSYLVYSLIESGIYAEIESDMLEFAKRFAEKESVLPSDYEVEYIDEERASGFGEGVQPPRCVYSADFPARCFHALNYAIGEKTIVLKRDITRERDLLSRIEKIVLTANVISLALIPIVAFIYSYFLARPIRTLTEELAKMNERSLSSVNEERDVPVELRPLTQTLNRLLSRIERHIAYQRELFVGIAHELKTPLAVIRTQNDVTLLRTRTPEKYQEILRENNRRIAEMNNMTQTVLNLGRAEYAQFDPPETVDMSRFLRAKARDFAMLANDANRELIVDIKPESLIIQTRPTLVSHIVQNLFSNALKFTPEGKRIFFQSSLEGARLIVETIDEGVGVAEGFDLFAPFASKGEKGGVGLGLYLAKNAATAMGAQLTIKNREGASGAIASLIVELDYASVAE
jgi:two-component system OmpR family sensor kinase